MELRFNMQPSGELTPRKVAPEAALLALKTILARRAEGRAAAAEGWKGAFDQVMEEVQRAHDGLEAQLAQPVRVAEAPRALAPPEALMALGDAETLGSRQKVNNLLDVWVGSLQSSLEGKVVFPGGTGEDARALLGLWFGEGRGFLAYAHDRQWLAIDHRWGVLAPEASARVARLGVGDTVAMIQALNGWFGSLLRDAGELPAPSPPPVDNAPAVYRALMRLLHFAAAAWPGEEGEATRRRMIDPYLEAVRAASAARAQSLKGGAAPSPEVPPQPLPLT